MERKSRLLSIVALIAVMAAGTAAAGGRHGGWDDYGAVGVRGAYQLDDLTPEQQAQLDALRDELRAERGQWREQRQQLRDAMRSGADVATIRPLAEQQGKRVADMIVRRAEVQAKLKQILTPEQQEQLANSRCDRGRWK